MTKLRTVLLVTLAATSVAGSFSTAANACGFLACIADKVMPGSGPILDGVHEGLGKPLDQVRDRALEELFDDE